MPNTYSFLTYNEIVDNDIHIGTSIDIDGLTLEDIKEAIERQKLLKKCGTLCNEDIIQIEKMKRREEKI